MLSTVSKFKAKIFIKRCSLELIKNQTLKLKKTISPTVQVITSLRLKLLLLILEICGEKRELVVTSSTSLWACCTVWPSKLMKHQSLEQRKVYRRISRGEWMACAQKSKLSRGFGEGFLLAKCGVRPLGLWLYSDWLVVRPQGGAPGISPSALSYHPPPARGPRSCRRTQRYSSSLCTWVGKCFLA